MRTSSAAACAAAAASVAAVKASPRRLGIAPRSELDRLNRDTAGHLGDLSRHLSGPFQGAPDLAAAHLRVGLAG